ncbi:Mobile element protein [Lachnospiraceae bacterium TWA4]|nr:Mobile element protein [Lachnospiraceae bacterium TWA4]
MDPTGWRVNDPNDSLLYDIRELEDTDENRKKVFYKQRFIEGNDSKRDIDFDQTLIVTYSLKYKNYQKTIRDEQINRALHTMQTNPKRKEKSNPNDYRRFIKKSACTTDGECAEKTFYTLDHDKIQKEERLDGFYAVYTNLNDDPLDIIVLNKNRWEIEESFRIMKTDFDARPVYLRRDDRIKAHFTICFIALLIYRILEKKLDEEFTCEELLSTLQAMRVTSVGEEGFIPSYTRTIITDALHEYAGFRTDYELICNRTMKGICRKSKE